MIDWHKTKIPRNAKVAKKHCEIKLSKIHNLIPRAFAGFWYMRKTPTKMQLFVSLASSSYQKAAKTQGTRLGKSYIKVISINFVGTKFLPYDMCESPFSKKGHTGI